MSKEPSDSTPATGFPMNPKDALEFMQKMWSLPFQNLGAAMLPGASAMPGIGLGGTPGTLPFPNPLAMFAAIDPKQVERKIDELRVIEGWLQMSLNMMQMSIKTLELQKASLEALRGSGNAGE